MKFFTPASARLVQVLYLIMNIMNTILFTILGYLSGSVLYSRLYSTLFHTGDTSAKSDDGNPGAFNAFKNGGLVCGIFVLLGDLFKAFLPVYFYLMLTEADIAKYGIAVVMWAPVFGHLFPLFYHFRGGKGIAASFGSLLALWAAQVSAIPVLTLAALFLFFKLIIQVRPDFYLTGLVFLLLPAFCWMGHVSLIVLLGTLLISASVLLRLSASREERPVLEVSLLWKH